MDMLPKNKWLLLVLLLVFIAVWTYLSYTCGCLPQHDRKKEG